MAFALPVLWWNGTAIAGSSRTMLPADGDAVLAFCAFVEGLSPVPKAIRLFYHSPTLEHLASTCPKGNRRTIQRALGARFSALSDPTTTWAAHRVRTNASGTTTILYIEEEPILSRLRAALDDRGIELETAFPILALLEAAPSASRLDRPIIALLHTDEAAAVYWRTAEGDRHAAFFDGNTTRERAVRELVTGLSVFKAPPCFVVVNLGTSPVELGSITPKEAKALSAADFFSNAQALGAREVCSFLAPPSLFTVDRVCHVAALILLLTAATTTATYYAAIRAAQANMTLLGSEERGLQEENARLRANKAHIEEVEAILREISIAPQVKRRFLEALGRARPMQISIRSVTLNEATWTLTGTAHEGVGVEKGPFQAFLANFRKNQGWTFGPDSEATVLRAADFTLSGSIP